MSVILNHAVNGHSATSIDPDYVVFPAAQEIVIDRSDEITVFQSDHDDLNANVNLQVDNVDVSGSNPVPVTAAQSTASNLNAQVVGNTASGSADTGNGVKVSGVFTVPTPVFTAGQRADLQVDSRGNLFVNTDTRKPAYSASAQAINCSGTITDLVVVQGSASRTIRIKKCVVQGSASANAVIDILFLKRSAANSGGTTAAMTAVPFDSIDAAATATVFHYTAPPTSLGTLTGVLCGRKGFLNGSNSNPAEYIEIKFGENNMKAVVLRGTAEFFAVNLDSLAVGGDLYNVCIEWTEE